MEQATMFSSAALGTYSDDELNYHWQSAHQRQIKLNKIVSYYIDEVDAALKNKSLSAADQNFKVKFNAELRDVAIEMRDQAKKIVFSCKIEAESRLLED